MTRPSTFGALGNPTIELLLARQSSPPRMQRSSRLPRSQRRSLVERRRAAAAPLAGERNSRNHDAWKRTCSRQIKPDAKRQEPRWKQDRKEDGEAIHTPAITDAQDRRPQQEKNVNLVAWRSLTCGCVSEIAGATRSHAEASGDLHGRKHAYTLRRSDDDLTRRGPLLRQAGGPARRSSA